MKASFTITAEPERDLIRVVMSGLFMDQDVASFQARRVREFAKLRCTPNQHLTLVDLREMKIQTQDMVIAFRDILSDPRFHSRKLAFAVSSTLARMQLVRAMEGRNAAYFTDPATAEAWLFDLLQADAA